MSMDGMSYICTSPDRCLNCSLCVRICPTRAICISNEETIIDYNLCINCGMCLKECPSGAKSIVSCTKEIKDLIRNGHKVAISMAPSFAAAFCEEEACRMPAVLRALGFGYISEAVEAARHVTENMLKDELGGNICTACPAVISYIEKFRPELKNILIPVVSPMVNHGRILKERLGNDWAIVFVGPCVAKRLESQRPENQGAVDYVLTFSELIQWLADEGIEIGRYPISDFENYVSLDEARLFPLRGGLYKTDKRENLKARGPDPVLHINGSIDVMRILSLPSDRWDCKVIEPLFCSEGCINGSGFPTEKSLIDRKKDLIRYARAKADLKTGG